MEKSNTKTIARVGGYLYSPGTKKGFERMKRLGIPRPKFRLEAKVAATLKRHYRSLIRSMLLEFKAAAANANITMDAALTQDSLDDLLDFFEQMGKELQESQKAGQDAVNRANMGMVANNLQSKWSAPAPEGQQELDDFEAIAQSFEQNQRDILRELFTDSDTRTQAILVSMTLPKQEVFNANMGNLRKLYLDNTKERLRFEEDAIKRRFLKRLMDYSTGKAERMDFDDLTKMAYQTGDNMARLFARDQMARFNKAITLSTFVNAGVTKVKWITSHDVRVRPTHKALDGQVFDINNLPDEVDDYNCRCGLVPVEWADDNPE